MSHSQQLNDKSESEIHFHELEPTIASYTPSVLTGLQQPDTYYLCKKLRLFRLLAVSMGFLSIALLVLLTSLVLSLIKNPFVVQDTLFMALNSHHSHQHRQPFVLSLPRTQIPSQFISVEELNKGQSVKPIHSHNDYTKPTPLYDALALGINSVEADVWYLPSHGGSARSDEELYVGHHSYLLSSTRTLQSLYLGPIMTLLDSVNNATGSINSTKQGVFYDEPDKTLYLHIDFKNLPVDTFRVLDSSLTPFKERGYLTVFDTVQKLWKQGPLTIISTGEIPYEQIESQKERLIFMDAPLALLYNNEDEFKAKYNNENCILVSDSLKRLTGTKSAEGGESLSQRQLDIIDTTFQRAHELGLKVRIWETPTWPIVERHNVWRQLENHGIDLLNADDLADAVSGIW